VPEIFNSALIRIHSGNSGLVLKYSGIILIFVKFKLLTLGDDV